MKVLPLKNHPRFLKNTSDFNKNKLANSGKILRFPVFYRIDDKVAKPGEPGWWGSYTPPTPYGKNADSPHEKTEEALLPEDQKPIQIDID